MKLTNTWKHAAVALVAGLVCWFIDKVIHWIDPAAAFELGGFWVLAFLMGTVVFELNQDVTDYVDSIVDVGVANLVFCVVLWACGVI